MKRMVFALLLWHAFATLEMVIEVFRHGARSPMVTDGYLSFGAEWDIGPEQLTPSGERQHYLLGMKRRLKYINDLMFLADEYVPGTIYAESTDYNRTQMSAYSHLWGLYPPDKRQKTYFDIDGKNTSVNTHIPVHMRSKRYGFLNGMNEGFWTYNKNVLKVSEIEANEEFTNHQFIQDMINELNEKLALEGNNKYKTFSDIYKAVDAYYSITFNNKSHTVQMSDGFKARMPHYLKLEMFHKYLRDKMGVKSASGNFFGVVNSLISHKTNIVNPSKENNLTDSIPKDAKYYLLSGHDTTIASILAGISHKEEDFPAYAASITIELHREHDYYYVHVLYNDKYLNIHNLCNNPQNKWNPKVIMDYLQSRMIEGSYSEFWSKVLPAHSF